MRINTDKNTGIQCYLKNVAVERSRGIQYDIFTFRRKGKEGKTEENKLDQLR